MSDSKAFEIVHAALNRMRLADLESIIKAAQGQTQEQLNGNRPSQAEADNGLKTAVANAFHSMLPNDQRYLDTLAK
ncbi:hypothetical protein [Pseudomonas sp.]|uniref:hypothetical protein n=1 Tax=Pseudomonas sp. TaxID=306 RepID=UPI0028A13A27|nr:hypothetical protein [Pseudomonas sp.]